MAGNIFRRSAERDTPFHQVTHEKFIAVIIWPADPGVVQNEPDITAGRAMVSKQREEKSDGVVLNTQIGVDYKR